MPKKQSKKHLPPQRNPIKRVIQAGRDYWRDGSIWRKLGVGFFVALILWVGAQYSVAQWYIFTQKDKPLKYGATFIPQYARQLGIDPEETMDAMINDLGIRQFRLTSYWSIGEKQRGTYDFSELDWQMEKARQSGSKVSLSIGLRQPRWPECHMPKWAEPLPMSEWSVELKKYMKATIERYKNHPSLESYQLENEFFMTVFGICPDHSKERLIDEYHFVKELDPTRKVIISRSNNWVGIPFNEPLPDETAISVYKRVWDKSVVKRYFEYPLPAWFYAMLAGTGKIVTGRDMIIHELQAESWLPDGYQMNDVADVPEQNKSMTPERLKNRIEYGRATGMREIYVWGVEWWYWRKVVANDPALWEAGKSELQKNIPSGWELGPEGFRYKFN